MAAIAEGIPYVNTSKVDAASGDLLDSMYGQQLLTSLAAFIQHVVQPHVKKAEGTMDSAEASTHLDPASNIAFSSPTLLSSLANFVRDVVALETPTLAQDGVLFVQAEVEPKTDLVPSNTDLLSSAHTMSDNFKDALNSTKEEIEKIVYNDMPIRLLAFDENGNGVRLIERNEVVRHIMDCKPEQLDGLMAQYNDGVDPQISIILGDYFSSRAQYAILSHTWIRDFPSDVVYTEWSQKEQEQNPRGLKKITKFCKVAALDYGMTLAWMDTVCIDKNSSSELDESIGSMYKWYRNSAVCMAYLSGTVTVDQMHDDSWFKRGWTLQELLAPTKVEFYNRKWNKIGAYINETLVELPLFPTAEERILHEIETATSITEREISRCRTGRPDAIPIGRRMQMATKRQVTRVEDRVYSLMGLLGVKISIAYGEGEKSAFNRLLRELINTQPFILDIFNCTTYHQLLPSGLDDYQERLPFWDRTGNYSSPSSLDEWKPFEPLTVTHLGCRIPLLLAPALWTEGFNPQPPPFGDLFGSVMLTPERPTRLGPLAGRYDILCARLYTDEEVTTRKGNDFHDNEYPYVVTFGIINFGLDNSGLIRLPFGCLAIPLDCGVNQAGTIEPTDPVFSIRGGPLIHFPLNSISGYSQTIRKETLGDHGLQIVILHL